MNCGALYDSKTHATVSSGEVYCITCSRQGVHSVADIETESLTPEQTLSRKRDDLLRGFFT